MAQREWLALPDRFMALRDCNSPHQPLYAWRYPDNFASKLLVRGWSIGGDSEACQEFKKLAFAGARMLGHPAMEDGTEWVIWLESLRRESLFQSNVKRADIEVRLSDGTCPEILEIENIWSRSGEYCEFVASGAAAISTPLRQPNQRSPTMAWQDIEIRVISDQRVQIFRAGKAAESLNFADMGFGDGRHKDGVPVHAWNVLLSLADGQRLKKAGLNGKPLTQLEKIVQEIRRKLRAINPTEDDPMPLVSRVYEPAFKITRSPAADY
jgi:hypothetical protein